MTGPKTRCASGLVERTRPGSGVVTHVGWGFADCSYLATDVAASAHGIVR